MPVQVHLGRWIVRPDNKTSVDKVRDKCIRLRPSILFYTPPAPHSYSTKANSPLASPVMQLASLLLLIYVQILFHFGGPDRRSPQPSFQKLRDENSKFEI